MRQEELTTENTEVTENRRKDEPGTCGIAMALPTLTSRFLRISVISVSSVVNQPVSADARPRPGKLHLDTYHVSQTHRF